MSDLIFTPGLAVKALKSSHYGNTANAIAEIIDNSVDAQAKNIHVVFFVNGQDTAPPDSIAVLDNGKGMEEKELRYSVQFGHTEHIDNPQQRKTLGRFGVGLLSASINQCHGLSIWSWKNGFDLHNKQMLANKISVNVNKIMETQEINLPKVSREILPANFMEAFHSFPKIQENPISGTLVEWQDFHNLTWKKTSTLCEHVKNQCGRIYRNYIISKRLKIVMLIFDTSANTVTREMAVPAIDPMFLHTWRDRELNQFSPKEPMFEPFLMPERSGEDDSPVPLVREIIDDQGNRIGKFRLLFSHRKIPQVVDRAKDLNHSDPGNAPFGKLANRLKGVSILREGRELRLDTSWLRVDATIDRWIKASVDFDSTLDDVFGVTNNKQEAIYLANLASVPLKELEESDFDGAHNKNVLRVAIEIKKGLAAMRTRVLAERKQERKNSRKTSPERLEETTLTQLKELDHLTKERAKENPIPADSKTPDPEKFDEVYKGTVYKGKDASIARRDIALANKLRVDIVASEEDLGAPIFDVREKNGMVLVIFNQDHPLYARILEALATPNGNGEANSYPQIEDVQKQLETSIWVIQRLFYSFARAEREAQGNLRDEFQQVRISWGRLAKFILRNEDD